MGEFDAVERAFLRDALKSYKADLMGSLEGGYIDSEAKLGEFNKDIAMCNSLLKKVGKRRER